MLLQMLAGMAIKNLRKEAEKVYADMDLNDDNIKDKGQIEATFKRIEADFAKIDEAIDDKLLMEAVADLAQVAGQVQEYTKKAKAKLEKMAEDSK